MNFHTILNVLWYFQNFTPFFPVHQNAFNHQTQKLIKIVLDSTENLAENSRHGHTVVLFGKFLFRVVFAHFHFHRSMTLKKIPKILFSKNLPIRIESIFFLKLKFSVGQKFPPFFPSKNENPALSHNSPITSLSKNLIHTINWKFGLDINAEIFDNFLFKKNQRESSSFSSYSWLAIGALLWIFFFFPHDLSAFTCPSQKSVTIKLLVFFSSEFFCLQSAITKDTTLYYYFFCIRKRLLFKFWSIRNWTKMKNLSQKSVRSDLSCRCSFRARVSARHDSIVCCGSRSAAPLLSYVGAIKKF